MAGESETYTKEQVEALVAERLAAETAGLKGNRDEVLKELKAAREKLANTAGMDPEEYKALKAEKEARERKKATDEGDFKSLEKQMIERHTAELSTEKGRSTKLQTALERHLVDAQLTAAIAKHKGDPELLLPIARALVKVKETDDGFESFVVDEKGNPRIGDGKGTPMSIEDLVGKVLFEKHPRAFDGTGSSGGGASKSTGSAGGQRVISRGDSAAFLANLEDIATGKAKVAA